MVNAAELKRFIQIILHSRQRTWSQSELGKNWRSVCLLRKRLDELSEAGVPFDVETDHRKCIGVFPKLVSRRDSAEFRGLLELHRYCPLACQRRKKRPAEEDR